MQAPNGDLGGRADYTDSPALSIGRCEMGKLQRCHGHSTSPDRAAVRLRGRLESLNLKDDQASPAIPFKTHRSAIGTMLL